MSQKEKLQNIKNSIASLLIVFFIFYAFMIIWPQGSSDLRTTLSIPKGSSLKQVSLKLKDKDIIKNEPFFLMAVKLMGYEKKLQAGIFKIDDASNNYKIIKQLVYGDESYLRITILEGWTLKDISREVENKLEIASIDFLNISKHPKFLKKFGIDNKNLEGYLFPETYFFSKNDSPEFIIEKMILQLRKNITSQMKARMDELGLDELEVITMASIIEGEAIYDDERATISSVYHNRLKRKMKLQADPTVQYIIDGPPRRLLNKDLKIESPYNTYLNYGLPPGPINNPGIQSILAALYPVESDFFYFVAKGDGYHTFSKTEREHILAKREFQKIRKKVQRQKLKRGVR